MNAQFEKYIANIPVRFQELHARQSMPLDPKAIDVKKAIYVFLENDKPVHVGRTRNLPNRVRGHVTKNHYSASFAFKETRKLLKTKASYKAENSRKALAQPETEFGQQFLLQIERVRKMQIKYLEVLDPIEQYLLELYAAMEYGTCPEEFDTH